VFFRSFWQLARLHASHAMERRRFDAGDSSSPQSERDQRREHDAAADALTEWA
jgi:hypothetical protein